MLINFPGTICMVLEKSSIKLEYVRSTGQEERKGSGPSVQGESNCSQESGSTRSYLLTLTALEHFFFTMLHNGCTKPSKFLGHNLTQAGNNKSGRCFARSATHS